ncbi:MAG: hypothetical protein ACM3JD_09935 [Rudaea sp.]
MSLPVLSQTLETPWTELEPIRVGQVPPGLGTPDLYVTAPVEKATLRVDVYADRSSESLSFKEAIIWADWLVIGFGHRLYLISLVTQLPITINLGSYFAHLYPQTELLLVATAERVYGIDRGGKVKWISPQLAIDGVIIQSIVGDVASGAGQWDPPGGWRPFRLHLHSGKPI